MFFTSPTFSDSLKETVTVIYMNDEAVKLLNQGKADDELVNLVYFERRGARLRKGALDVEVRKSRSVFTCRRGFVSRSCTRVSASSIHANHSKKISGGRRNFQEKHLYPFTRERNMRAI